MNDEPKGRLRAWIGKTIIVLPFFCVNVLAAYVPTPLFLREISFSSRPKDAFFRVPVYLAYLAVESRGPAPPPFDQPPLIGRGLVVAFLLLLFVASAALYNSRKAWVAMPSIVLVYSLLQGVIAAIIIGLNALDAIGH
jgi:hypothetical protein